MPKYSVVIPTYNRERTIERAILSCINQTIQVHEIIVVDDGSTDNTASIVNELITSSKIIKLIELDSNRGAQVARLRGVLEAKGDWVVFLDSDDELTPDSIELREKSFLESGFPHAIVYGDARYASNGANGNTEYTRLVGYCYKDLLQEMSLCAFMVVMVPKIAFSIGGFPSPDFPSCQDDDFILTLAKNIPVIYCDKGIIANIYFSENSISNVSVNQINGLTMLTKKFRKDIIEHCGYIHYLHYRLKLTYKKAKRFQETTDNKLLRKINAKKISYLRRVLIRKGFRI